MSTFNPLHHNKLELNVQTQLSCGHVVKTRLEPLNKKAKFGCTSGLGCGYQLSWVKTRTNEGEWRENNVQ